MSDIITDQLTSIFDLSRIPVAGGSIGPVLAVIGVDPQQLINNVITAIVDQVFVSTGLDQVLSRLPNPISPPMVSVEMEYELKLRPASFFRLIRAGDPYIRLRRVAKAGQVRGFLEADCLHGDCTDPKCGHRLLMQTTGGRLDMPILPPLFLQVNLMFGDCTKK
jgi:hypothetical protein